MPFNPRRERRAPPPPAVRLTDEQIAEALERALTLRRRAANDPAQVTAQAMTAYDAIRATEQYRDRSYRYRVRHTFAGQADPWWWIGWVHQEAPSDYTPFAGRLGYRRSWEVWLSSEDGRVWLKLERYGKAWGVDDPYP